MIREAIKSLEMIGLVSCVQGGGNFISTNMDNSMTEPLSIMFMLEDGSLGQVQELRRILEIGSVRLAAVRAGQTDLMLFEKICGVLENHSDPCDESEQDRLFHYAIAQAAGNPLFTTMLNAVSALIENQIRGVRRKMLQEADTLNEVNKQHRDILAAIRSGDPGQAEAAMTRHLDFIEKYLAP
jgi:GntR family transcriptional repressor for pyruvate dehydrogenase complex